MCGIAGIVGSSAPAAEALHNMGTSLRHRGPDDRGTWHDELVGLTFQRLAILDLEERSNQPQHLGPLHLVFNGEIYNYRELRLELEGRGHRFVTEGDGEVLLHAWQEWEEGALDRFNGMFAFAVWHDERRELVCARDAFGEKPLFWTTMAEGFAFASEIRALLTLRPQLSAPRDQAISPFLGLGLLPGVGESFFADVHQLPGAHVLRYRDGRVDVRRYWSPRQVDIPSTYDGATEELRVLLDDSIRLRLRSDVPVGTSLSGGVDSSAIVCLAGQIAGEHRRHAFTARFPGFERDEWRYAEVVARSAGVLEHHAITPKVDDLLEDLDAVVNHQGEPFGSASIYAQWCVMRAAHEAGVTVLLDGQGADELFGGYPSAVGWAIRSQGPLAVVRGLTSEHRTNVLVALGSEGIPVPTQVVARFRRMYVSPYASSAVREAAEHIPRLAYSSADFGSPLTRELVRQSFATSLPDLLRYADRNSMAHSREVRLPFLDRRIAEFAFSLPARFLYRRGLTKAVLRDAVRDVVPQEVLKRRDKVGYEPPQAHWFREAAFKATVGAVLLDDTARRRGLYATDAVETDLRAGRWRDLNAIWRALNLELWLRSSERPRAEL